MTETIIEVILGTAVYTLIATRTTIVLFRYRVKNYPDDKQILMTLFLSVIWPASAFMLGFITLMTGEGLPAEASPLSRPNGGSDA